MELREFVAKTLGAIGRDKGTQQMELREFVAKTLGAIVDGVEDAGKNAPAERLGVISPHFPGQESQKCAVEFDIAVTEGDKTNAAGKGSIKVLSFEAGGKGSKEWERSTVSRVKFSVPIIFAVKVINPI
jgi:hypothetical protein